MNLSQKTIIIVSVILLIMFTVGGYYFAKSLSYEAAPADEKGGAVIRSLKKFEKIKEEKASSEPGLEQISEEAAGGALKERVIEMAAKQWMFEPNVIAVKKGEKVILKIKSVDVKHGFSLPDFGVSAELAPGRTEIVEFVADKAGEFEFRCSVFCGRGHLNMKGKLIVK